MKSYDFVFLIEGLPITFTPGGYIITFELAKRLAADGYKVAILFLRDSGRVAYVRGLEDSDSVTLGFNDYFITHFALPLAGILSGRNVTRESQSLQSRMLESFRHFYRIEKMVVPFLSRFIMMIFNTTLGSMILYQPTRRLMGIKDNYDFRSISGVDILFRSNLKGLVASNIIATGYLDSFFLNEYKDSKTRKYLLIQSFADDPVVSGNVASLVRESYSFPLRKIVVNKKLYHRFQTEHPAYMQIGFDRAYFHLINPIEARNGRFVLFPVLRSETKGAIYAIDAMKMLKASLPDITLMAFGNFRKSEIPSYVDYYYLPSRRQLRDLYNSAAIFVLPSIAEGMSLPTLEAMSCGCAVICTDNGGTNEYIRNGENGIVVPTRDSVAIRNAVLDLIQDEQKRLRIAFEGLRTSGKFTFEEMYRNFTRIMSTAEDNASLLDH
jgi:glycosyltransferase involved in cell wall biosynthesis